MIEVKVGRYLYRKLQRSGSILVQVGSDFPYYQVLKVRVVCGEDAIEGEVYGWWIDGTRHHVVIQTPYRQTVLEYLYT